MTVSKNSLFIAIKERLKDKNHPPKLPIRKKRPINDEFCDNGETDQNFYLKDNFHIARASF
jgi:hypothetical protein